MSAVDFLPKSHSLAALAAAVQRCRGCELYRDATQAVFGEGKSRAQMILVGEQPGDREDLEGRPFVGPAGELLDRALEEAGIQRRQVYITNAVKHFKWEPRGARRLHKKPSARELAACRPWLDAELEAVRPDVVVCLGATAAQSLFGKAFRITAQRGRLLDVDNVGRALATWHPSAVLRAPEKAQRHEMRRQLIADLATAAAAMAR
jgi:DNA polymerase